MKQFLILCIITVNLLAEGGILGIDLSDINPIKSTKNIIKNIIDDDSDNPDWLKQHKDGTLVRDDGDVLYIVGQSSLVDEKYVKSANSEATKDGLAQIASYINIDIGTDTSTTQENKDGQVSKNIERNINTLSFVELDGIIPINTFVDDEGDKIISYAFFKITKKDLEQKREEFEKKDKAYKELLNEFRELVRTNQISLAKDLSFKINSHKRSQYDNEYKKLQEALKTSFEVNLQLSSNKYKLGEYVNITLRPSKSVYVYLLLEYGNGKNIQMLFPSRYDNDNFISAKKSKKIKKFKIRKQHTTKSKNKIILYSSNSPIDFNSYVDDGFKLSNNEDAQWREMINKRLKNSVIYTKEHLFEVDSKKQKKKKVCIKTEGNGLILNRLLKRVKKVYKKQFKVNRNCKNVDFRTIIAYNESIESNENSAGKLRVIQYMFILEDENNEEIFSSEEITERFISTASSKDIMKEIRGSIKENLKEIIGTIKE